ncbi:hypothetical protein NQ317_017069 [Molorchus minor]|uniref:Uncharacterized protein n=1 Tax=Molorchus minor TaxID=1323400 RepID=A0ABQ9K5Y6_9CUCU|nr:hypothetical protein NQ317_017069 [Molorchus minor]
MNLRSGKVVMDSKTINDEPNENTQTQTDMNNHEITNTLMNQENMGTGDAQNIPINTLDILLQKLSEKLDQKFDQQNKTITLQMEEIKTNTIMIQTLHETMEQQNQILNDKIDKQYINLNKKIENETKNLSSQIKINKEQIIQIKSENMVTNNTIYRLESDFETYKTKIDQNNAHVNTKINNINTQITDIETNLTKDINLLNKKMDTETQNIRGEINKINVTGQMPYYLCNSYLQLDNNYKFYGDKRTHPKMFLKHLKQTLEIIPNNINIKFHIRNSLKGEAETWFNIIEDNFETFEQFKDLFIGKYWCESYQSRIRENLFNGRFNEDYGYSMENYILKKFSYIKFLDPPMPENEVVRYLARHFESNIRDVPNSNSRHKHGRKTD